MPTAALLIPALLAAPPAPPTGVVLVMADDLGFAQTGYAVPGLRGPHPVLRTPHLNAMAANGLSLDGFRAGAFTCSPTRATVLTGRTNDRTGVKEHGYPLHPAEVTLPRLLGGAGYATGHFGKWHLSGFQGPGVPVLADDPLSPGRFGFDTWLSVTNFFDRDPLMSREGAFEEFVGDSSEVIVDEALDFVRDRAAAGQPFLAVVWYGSPHSPFVAAPADAAAFAGLPETSANHHAEIAAMDRSLGTLRVGLREAGVARNTLLWFCSDNGGLPRIEPSTVAPLRGRKGTIYSGGLRVPAVVEWPAAVAPGRRSDAVTTTADILPTICALCGVAPPADGPLDGVTLAPLLTGAEPDWERPEPLGFRQNKSAAWIDGDLKLLTTDRNRAAKNSAAWELYDLSADPGETRDLSADRPDAVQALAAAFAEWDASVDASAAGADYPPGSPPAPPHGRRHWASSPEYRPHLERFRQRPEYRARIRRHGGNGN